MSQIGTLRYNSDEDRFGIEAPSGQWIVPGLHCGQTMEIDIGTGWVSDRIEYGNDWYLTESRLTGQQLEGLKVRC
jgi:hypothetical protein